MCSYRDTVIAQYKLLVRPGLLRRTTAEKWAEKHNVAQYGILCGSYRRSQPHIGDIDLLVPAGTIPDVIAAFNIKPYTTTRGICSGFVKIGTMYSQIDLLEYTPDTKLFMLLYFTGSKAFNIRMRAIAKKKGYTLNQYGLFKKTTGARVTVKDERDIFRKLNMDYVRTECRE